MKNIYHPLSIIGILALACAFSACGSAIIPYNTSIAVQSEHLSDVKLTEKRVLIVSYDSDLSSEFIISLKNYLREDLKKHNIVAERINIRDGESATDLAELDKLKTTFTPDYLLTIKVRNERVRKMYTVGSHVKVLRGMTLDFNILPANSEGTSLWRGNATINHFYTSEAVSTAKKLVKELGINMQKDLIIN